MKILGIDDNEDLLQLCEVVLTPDGVMSILEYPMRNGCELKVKAHLFPRQLLLLGKRL